MNPATQMHAVHVVVVLKECRMLKLAGKIHSVIYYTLRNTGKTHIQYTYKVIPSITHDILLWVTTG